MDIGIIKENCNIKLSDGFEKGVPYEVFAVSGGKIILIDTLGNLLDLFPMYVRITEKAE